MHIIHIRTYISTTAVFMMSDSNLITAQITAHFSFITVLMTPYFRHCVAGAFIIMDEVNGPHLWYIAANAYGCFYTCSICMGEGLVKPIIMNPCLS